MKKAPGIDVGKILDRLDKEKTRKWLPARASLGPLYSLDWSDLITLIRKYGVLDYVPERRTGKRSRLHLDLYAENREREVARLVEIGAVRYPWRYRPGDDFVVLADPDDNLFCVVQADEG